MRSLVPSLSPIVHVVRPRSVLDLLLTFYDHEARSYLLER